MRYKVGDKVRVRGGLEVGKTYGARGFVDLMTKYCGETARVTEVLSNSYRMDIDEAEWYWTDEMLRPVEFKIWCETKEEKQAVLEKLEKEGYVWKSGEKPTELTYSDFLSKNPRGLCISDNKLSWENSKQRFNSNNLPKITPSEFTGIDFSEKIIITKTPTGAKATYGDKTVTTEGDFEDASRQALAEVLCPFKVGDEVKLKRNGVVGEIIDISGETRVIFHTKKDIHDEWCLLSELEPYTEPSYNAKLFCIKGSDMYKVFEEGHIYKIIDGKFNGEGRRYDSLEDINRIFFAQFMEVKGGLDE